jgi:ankyrin repeat protein
METVKLLVEKDSELIHAPYENGYTPLHRSIERKHWKAGLFEILWRQGPNLQHSTHHRNPPMLYAVKRGNLEAVCFLILQDPVLAASRNPDGISALDIAIENDYAEILDEPLKIPHSLDANAPFRRWPITSVLCCL